VELSVEVQGTSVPVPEELFFEGEPRLTARVRLVANDVLELDGDGSVEPGEDHGVHQGPGWGRRGGDVVEDVVVEGVATQGEEDLPLPARVVGDAGSRTTDTRDRMFCSPAAWAWRAAMWSASSPEAWGASGVGGGVSWATGGGPMARRCAVAIWAVSVAARACSCSSARDAACSRS
jgi:hypothetical protein